MSRVELSLDAHIEFFMVGAALGCCGSGRLGFQQVYNSFEVSNIYHCDFYYFPVQDMCNFFVRLEEAKKYSHHAVTIIPMVDEVSRSIR